MEVECGVEEVDGKHVEVESEAELCSNPIQCRFECFFEVSDSSWTSLDCFQEDNNDAFTSAAA